MNDLCEDIYLGSGNNVLHAQELIWHKIAQVGYFLSLLNLINISSFTDLMVKMAWKTHQLPIQFQGNY